MNTNKTLKNSLKNVHICEDWIKIRLHGRGREGDYVWIGLRLHGRLDGKYSNHFQAEKGTTFGNGLSIERVSDRVSECVCM